MPASWRPGLPVLGTRHRDLRSRQSGATKACAIAENAVARHLSGTPGSTGSRALRLVRASRRRADTHGRRRRCEGIWQIAPRVTARRQPRMTASEAELLPGSTATSGRPTGESGRKRRGL
jgi:hypothetical protein